MENIIKAEADRILKKVKIVKEDKIGRQKDKIWITSEIKEEIKKRKSYNREKRKFRE